MTLQSIIFYASLIIYLYLRYSWTAYGVIKLPTITQLIMGSIGTGIFLLYLCLNIRNIFIQELAIYAIIIIIFYLNRKLNEKALGPDPEYILSLYKNARVKPESPEDCVVCLDMVTFMQTAKSCKHCKKTFHKKCLQSWFEGARTCPHCRHEY